VTRAHAALLLAASLGAVGIALSACGRDAPAETRLLVLDGIEIQLAEVEPYVAFLDSFLPEVGRKTKVQRVLDEFLIPLRLAQRAAPERRRELRDRALALCSVATNVIELEQQTAQMLEKRRAEVTRMHTQLPIGMYAFDPMRVGAVSPPIEVPEGWFVIGTYDLKESRALVTADTVDAVQVGFFTHTPGQWREWYAAEKPRLADKATFVHPDYVNAMPVWIRPKKQP